MIYTGLKKTVTFHLIAGIILSAIIISVISLSRYENSLLDAVSKVELIKTNTLRMKQAAANMDSTIKKINSLLPNDYYSKSPRELLLLALDDIKTSFKGSEITVTNFDEKAGEISLPVSIKIPVDDYVMLVNMVVALQSMKIPQFAIKNIVVERRTDARGAIIINIEGLLRMPAERLKNK